MKKKQTKTSNFIAPIVTIVVSCAIGFYLFSGSNSQPAVAIPEPKVVVKEAPTVQILVATNDIAVGKKLNFNDLSWRAWPESLLNPLYITQNEKPDYINQLVGGIVKTPIISGEPIVEGKIIQSGGRGAMSVLLRKGMRAVSVPISVSTAVGGFILPGDYVDIILTSSVTQQNIFGGQPQRKQSFLDTYLAYKMIADMGRKQEAKEMSKIEKSPTVINNEEIKPLNNKNITNVDMQKNKDEKQQEISNKIAQAEIDEQQLIKKVSKENELLVTNGSNISEVMLENVKVLAIDQRLEQASNNPNGEPSSPALIGATATLEVTPEQAKLLAWSSGAGNLTLSLRSFRENLSEAENVSLSQQIPQTKTSFAWALKTFDDIGSAAGPKKIELIRNGSTSIIYDQDDAQINDLNTAGAPNVQR